MQCEYAMTKSLMCCSMNEEEQQQYSELYTKIEEGIVQAQADIEDTKKQLQQARQVRRPLTCISCLLLCLIELHLIFNQIVL